MALQSSVLPSEGSNVLFCICDVDRESDGTAGEWFSEAPFTQQVSLLAEPGIKCCSDIAPNVEVKRL